jgi:hypothetical protein
MTGDAVNLRVKVQHEFDASKSRYIATIIQSFEAAESGTEWLRHPTRPDLTVTESWPVLPAIDISLNSYVDVEIDAAAVPEGALRAASSSVLLKINANTTATHSAAATSTILVGESSTSGSETAGFIVPSSAAISFGEQYQQHLHSINTDDDTANAATDTTTTPYVWLREYEVQRRAATTSDSTRRQQTGPSDGALFLLSLPNATNANTDDANQHDQYVTYQQVDSRLRLRKRALQREHQPKPSSVHVAFEASDSPKDS